MKCFDLRLTLITISAICALSLSACTTSAPDQAELSADKTASTAKLSIAYQYGLAYAPATAVFPDAHMVQAAPASVVAAEDGAHHLAAQPGNHRGGGVSLQKPSHAFLGIVNAADREAPDAHPELFNFGIIFSAHDA